MNLCTLILIALLLPVTGYCDSGSGWFSGLFKSKAEKEKDVATKIATFTDDKTDWIWGLDFSSDGKYIVTDTPFAVEVHVWDWQSGHIAHILSKTGDSQMATEPIRYSPDGHLLAICHNEDIDGIVIRIWNAETWKVVRDITESRGGGCNAIGFTPDGKSLIKVSDTNPRFPMDSLIVYSTNSWEPVWGLPTVPFYPTAMTISPDGKFVAIGGDIINPHSWPYGTPVPTFGKPPLPNMQLIAIVDMSKRAIVRTIQTKMATPGNTLNKFGHLAWSQGGEYIALAGFGGVAVFDVHSGQQVTGEVLAASHMSLRYTPDGKYLLEGDEGGLSHGLGVRIWDGQHRELLQEIPGDIGSLAVSRDGHYFAASSRKKISVWQLK